MPDHLLISETFRSIQGEGVLTGVPSFFIRLAGCHLRCVWCDTPYASWEPAGDKLSVDELTQQVVASSVRHVVITGGEPLISPHLSALTQALRDRSIHITIETAAPQPALIPCLKNASPDAHVALLRQHIACDLVSISPKLANSTPTALTKGGSQLAHVEGAHESPSWSARHEQRRLSTESIAALLAACPAHQLKFVVASETDMAEIESLLAALRDEHAAAIEPGQVLLMPEGTPPSPQRMQAVARLCMERGYRYCHRVHVDVFGHTRGT